MILFFDEGDPINTDPDSTDLFNTGQDTADTPEAIQMEGSGDLAALAQEEGSSDTRDGSEQEAEQIDLSDKIDDLTRYAYASMLLLAALTVYIFVNSLFRRS